jgi:hypothetical protein
MVFFSYKPAILIGSLSALTFPSISSSQNVPFDIGSSVMSFSSFTTTSSHLTRAVSDACYQEATAIQEAGWIDYLVQAVDYYSLLSSSLQSCMTDEDPFDDCTIDFSFTNSDAYEYCLSLGGSFFTADILNNSEGCPLATGMEPVTVILHSMPFCGGPSCTTADLEGSNQDPNSCEQSIVNVIAWTTSKSAKVSSKSSKKGKSAKVSSKSPKIGKSAKVRNLRL